MAEYKPLTEEEIKAMQRAAKTAELLAAPANFLGRAVNNLWEFPGVVTTGKTWNQRNYQPPPVTEIPTSVAGDGIFSATLKDSEDATRDALVNAGRDAILPGTGDRRTLDSSQWGEPSSVTDEKKEGTQKVAEIPKGPNFTTAERRALNQVRGSVAKNKAQLKQWQFEQDQQRSVAGALGKTNNLQDQPTNTTKPTDTTADPNKFGYNESLKGVEPKFNLESGKFEIPGQDKFVDPNALKSSSSAASTGLTGGAKMGVQLGVALAQSMLADKDKDKALQNKEALATAKLGSSTNRQSQLGWLEEPEWMSWIG